MTFDEWFSRQHGKRPTSISLMSLHRQMIDAREHAKDAEAKWREMDNWERAEFAARLAWKAAGGKL